MLGKPDLDLHLVSHQWGQDPEGVRLYTEHYGKVDVWAAKAQHIPTAEWLGPSEALCPLDELTRTEFFNDFLLRFDAGHALFGAVQDLGGVFSNLSIFRSHKREPFDQGNVNLIRFLSPHIVRAYRIHFELSDLKASSLSLQTALDSSPTGILLLDRDCRVITMNLAARTVIDQNDGLLIRRGRLQTEGINESTILGNLLFQAGPKCGKRSRSRGRWSCAGKSTGAACASHASRQIAVSPGKSSDDDCIRK